MSPTLLRALAAGLTLLAVLLAVAGWLLSRQDVQEAPPPAAPSLVPDAGQAPTGYPVLVAQQDLPAFSPLDAARLSSTFAVVHYPEPVAGSFADPAVVPVHSGAVLRQPLLAGDVLRARHFDEGSVLAATVPAGKRALAITVDEVIGGGSYLQPGDRVDVLYYVQSPEDGRPQLARRLLQGVRVLAYGERLTSVAPDEGASLRHAARSAVLAVSAVQAPALLLAEQTGRLRLAILSRDAEPPSAELQVLDLDNEPAVLLSELTVLADSQRQPASAARQAEREGRTHRVIQHSGGTSRSVELRE